MKIVMAERLALSLTHANLLSRAQNKHFSKKEDIIFRCFF